MEIYKHNKLIYPGRSTSGLFSECIQALGYLYNGLKRANPHWATWTVAKFLDMMKEKGLDIYPELDMSNALKTYCHDRYRVKSAAGTPPDIWYDFFAPTSKSRLPLISTKIDTNTTMAKDCLGRLQVAFKYPRGTAESDPRVRNMLREDEHGRMCMDMVRSTWGVCGGCTLLDPIDQSAFLNNILYDFMSIYFEPNNNIKRMRDTYIKKYKINPGRTCYTYIRRTDKLNIEASSINNNKTFNHLNRILNKNKNINTILLQTDDIQLIPEFKSQLKSNIKLKIINETFSELSDDELDINNINIDANIVSRPTHRTGDENTRISLAKAFMASILIGVRCKCSIMTPSNVVPIFNMWKVMKNKLGPETDILLTT
tara:strand:- start:1091 stop:2203 length:1113 start_codon:yes stop_codon:yes gene_type:complete